MSKVGIVPFSFALRRDGEPNPCNVKLGFNVERACLHLLDKELTPVIVPQWEIDLYLSDPRYDNVSNQHIAHTVMRHRKEGEYLGSEEVMAQAAEVFRPQGVRQVIVIANPFLHRFKCVQLARAEGFEIYPFKMTWIGFDPLSDQEWTRGPVPLLMYTIRQKLFGHHGQPLK